MDNSKLDVKANANEPSKTPAYLDVALEGVNLLEASAGTGKTFTVALLYLRAILGVGTPDNKPLRVNQVLVVTFTNAATEELIGRIRQRIKEALAYVESAASTQGKDDALNDVLKVAYNLREQKECLILLKTALSQISFANISTIHSFCADICASVAIDSGLPLDLSLSIDSEVVDESIRDLWRKNILLSDPSYRELVSSFSTHQSIYKKALSKTLKTIQPAFNEVLSSEFIELLQEINLQSFFDQYKSILKAHCLHSGFEDALVSLSKVDSETLTIPKTLFTKLANKKLLDTKKIKEGSPEEKLKAQYVSYIENSPLFKAFDSFSKLKGAGSTKVNLVDFTHLYQSYETLIERMQKIESMNAEVYSDRLIQLAAKVSEDKRVAQLMRERLPLAIIDEFQDTDPFQYQLFNNIYQGKGCGLLMVGDPKQAIYGFRGGDIHTYLHAKTDAEQSYNLANNFRSAEAVVEGVNAIFGQVIGEHKNAAKGPFKQNAIPFISVDAKANKSLIKINNDGQWSDLNAVHGEYLADNQDCELNSYTRQKLIANTSADYVAKLLGLADEGRCIKEFNQNKMEENPLLKKTNLENQPLAKSDIAFLVNSHSEAKLIRNALLDRDIPSLTQSRESIYQEQEAYDCWLILRALMEPSNHRHFEVALLANINGLGYHKVYHILNNEAILQVWLESVHELNLVLLEQGPMVAMNLWFSQVGANSYFMQLENDRLATNVLQLLEILQEDFTKYGGGQKLLKRFERDIANADAADEKLIRLESDEDRVKIITIHSSKGLEYPVVLVPFAWKDSVINKDKLYSAHDEDGNLQLGFSDKIKNMQKEELKQEKLRLFYVALTRASQHLVLYFIDSQTPKGSKPSQGYNQSPLGWYFPTNEDSNTVAMAFDDFKQVIKSANKKSISLDSVACLDKVASLESAPSLENLDKPADSIETELQVESVQSYKEFNGSVDRFIGTSSFSALTRGYSILLKDDDESEDGFETQENKIDIEQAVGRHALAKGADIGTALHNVLEHTDFRLWNLDQGSELNSDQNRDDDAQIKQVKQGKRVKQVKQVKQIEPAEEFLTQRVQYELKSNGVIYEEEELERLTPEYTQWMKEVIDTPFLYLDDSASNSDTSPKPPVALKNLTNWFPELTFTFNLSRKFGKSKLRELLKKYNYHLDGLSGNSIHGMLTGAIDLVFERDGKYYLADYKSNYLGFDYDSYDHEMLAKNNDKKAYTLQYLIYALALHKHLKTRILEYQYETHFGGVFYLYLRGMHPNEKHRGKGVFYHQPSLAVIEALDECICGESATTKPGTTASSTSSHSDKELV